MMGVLFCCGAGFFIRRRMYPPPLIEEPTFNVSYTRQPPNPAPGQPASSLSVLIICVSFLPQSVLKEINQAVWSLNSNDWFYWLFLLVAMQCILCLSAHVFILLLMYPV